MLVLDVVLLKINSDMEIFSQSTIFRRLIDRLVRAPVHLYHEVTPLGRITGYFNIDLPHLNMELYRTVASLIVESFSIAFILAQTL